MSCCCNKNADYGGTPYIVNTEDTAAQNMNFRTAIWTGRNLQMTVMSIPLCGEIGLEMHPNTDQIIRVEQGNAVVKMGTEKCPKDRRIIHLPGVFVFLSDIYVCLFTAGLCKSIYYT